MRGRGKRKEVASRLLMQGSSDSRFSLSLRGIQLFVDSSTSTEYSVVVLRTGSTTPYLGMMCCASPTPCLVLRVVLNRTPTTIESIGAVTLWRTALDSSSRSSDGGARLPPGKRLPQHHGCRAPAAPARRPTHECRPRKELPTGWMYSYRDSDLTD